METLFPVIFLGRAAENNVGQEARVHEMRTMWSPYDQSCNLGRPAGKKVGPEDRRVRPDYMTSHRGSTVTSCVHVRHHGMPTLSNFLVSTCHMQLDAVLVDMLRQYVR